MASLDVVIAPLVAIAVNQQRPSAIRLNALETIVQLVRESKQFIDAEQSGGFVRLAAISLAYPPEPRDATATCALDLLKLSLSSSFAENAGSSQSPIAAVPLAHAVANTLEIARSSAYPRSVQAQALEVASLALRFADEKLVAAWIPGCCGAAAFTIRDSIAPAASLAAAFQILYFVVSRCLSDRTLPQGMLGWEVRLREIVLEADPTMILPSLSNSNDPISEAEIRAISSGIVRSEDWVKDTLSRIYPLLQHALDRISASISTVPLKVQNPVVQLCECILTGCSLLTKLHPIAISLIAVMGYEGNELARGALERGHGLPHLHMAIEQALKASAKRVYRCCRSGTDQEQREAVTALGSLAMAANAAGLTLLTPSVIDRICRSLLAGCQLESANGRRKEFVNHRTEQVTDSISTTIQALGQVGSASSLCDSALRVLTESGPPHPDCSSVLVLLGSLVPVVDPLSSVLRSIFSTATDCLSNHCQMHRTAASARELHIHAAFAVSTLDCVAACARRNPLLVRGQLFRLLWPMLQVLGCEHCNEGTRAACLISAESVASSLEFDSLAELLAKHTDFVIDPILQMLQFGSDKGDAVPVLLSLVNHISSDSLPLVHECVKFAIEQIRVNDSSIRNAALVAAACAERAMHIIQKEQREYVPPQDQPSKPAESETSEAEASDELLPAAGEEEEDDVYTKMAEAEALSKAPPCPLPSSAVACNLALDVVDACIHLALDVNAEIASAALVGAAAALSVLHITVHESKRPRAVKVWHAAVSKLDDVSAKVIASAAKAIMIAVTICEDLVSGRHATEAWPQIQRALATVLRISPLSSASVVAVHALLDVIISLAPYLRDLVGQAAIACSAALRDPKTFEKAYVTFASLAKADVDAVWWALTPIDTVPIEHRPKNWDSAENRSLYRKQPLHTNEERVKKELLQAATANW